MQQPTVKLQKKLLNSNSKKKQKKGYILIPAQAMI